MFFHMCWNGLWQDDLCSIDCSWAYYPHHFRKFALCRGQTEINTWTALKPNWRKSTTNTLFFSMLLMFNLKQSEVQCSICKIQSEVAAYHNQSFIRCLLFPVFTGNHGKNLSWKVQKERQYFVLLLDQIQKLPVANYECSLCLSLGWILVTVSGHLSWLSAWHLSIPHYDTDSLDFIKTFHLNQIICFLVQHVNTFLLKFVNSQFASLSLFFRSFCTFQTNTLSVLWFKYIAKLCCLPETKPCILSCPQLAQRWLTPGFSPAAA